MKVIALVYHDVVESGADDSSGFPGRASARYKLTWAQFDQHLKAIAEAGREPTLIDGAVGGRDPRTSLVLTFDDGGASALRAGERLAESGWPGYFFITSDYLGSRYFLDAHGVRALRAMGHAIGSHSCSHPPRISQCGWEELLTEWRVSVERLSEILEDRVAVASVPGGYYSTRVAEAASAAGIDMLFTSEPRMSTWTVDGCLVLGRYSITRETPAATAGRLAAGKVAPRLRQATFWNVKKIAKAVPGDPYSKLRAAILGRRYRGAA